MTPANPDALVAALAHELARVSELETENAQLQAEVEALKGKLTEAADAADAPPSGYSTYQTSIDSEEADNLRRCREIVRAARAATAREG